ncbi:MAG: hypothetical protein K9K66_03010 [Desulfarculaceae bacterium]|nr:hypothetical protein [Desulfarculaceae bacterium]MCF8071019.1 hypothetical protein [Desulfarculaceae bacterium]MCF8100607.1 hypothetical protein [Desulfarculaceae bacterium]MCF8116959.1 hypothetical protein [Desulfarculaceae bacterium]
MPRLGDNIHEPTTHPATQPGHFRQHPSAHSYGMNENPQNKRRDLAGKYVLIAPEGAFVYRGLKQAVPLPARLREAVTPLSRGHRSRFDDQVISSFKTFFTRLLKAYGRQDLPLAAPTSPACARACS